MFSASRIFTKSKTSVVISYTPDFYATYDGSGVAATGQNLVTTQNVNYSTNSKVGNYAAILSGNNTGFRYGAKGSEFTFGTGDFSLTWWALCNSRSGGLGYGRTLIDFRPTSTNGAYFLFGVNPDGTAFFERNSTPVSSTKIISLNVWHKYLLVRASGVTSLYVDGELYLTTTDTTNYLAGDFKVGLNAYVGPVPTICWSGMVDDVKVYKGKVLPASASNPVEPNPAPAPAPNFSLLFENGINTVQNHTVLLNQGVQVLDVTLPTGASKAGKFVPTSTTSTTSGLRYQAIADEATFGTGNFTISFWVNPSARPTSGSSTIIDMRPVNSSGAYLYVGMNTDGTLTLFKLSETTNGSIALPLNTWSYVVIVRDAGTLRAFVNGTQALSVTDTVNYLPGALCIGQNAYYTTDGAARGFNGYIDEVKIYKNAVVVT